MTLLTSPWGELGSRRIDVGDPTSGVAHDGGKGPMDGDAHDGVELPTASNANDGVEQEGGKDVAAGQP